MKKKVFVLILALYMLMPVSGVFAEVVFYPDDNLDYKIGVFDENSYIKSLFPNEITDNDLNTFYSISNSGILNIKLDEPIIIKSYFLRVRSGSIELKYENNTLHSSGFESQNSITFNEPIIVDEIILSFLRGKASPYLIYEFEIFTEDYYDIMPPENIQNLNYTINNKKINFNYNLPEDSDFSHVKIYKDDVLVADNLTDTSYNVDNLDYGGTYNFKFTTVDESGNESEGVVETVTIAPPPELGGQEFEEQENGDYLVTWQQPETGQVRILVDGQEYVVVPASDKQFTIPAADMKYSALGDPLVGLQTIGDNGEESEVEQQESNVNLPFGINELLTTSAGLLRVIGSLILLGLSFILVPKFIKVIKQSLSNKKNAETERTEREQRVSNRSYREPRESRISAREGRTSTRVPREFRKGE